MEDPAEEWQWDDSSIDDDDVLYRHFLNEPKYFKTEDRFNGDTCLMPVAFNLADADIDPEPGDVEALQVLDPAPRDVDDVRTRLGWGKSRASRAFRVWDELQSTGQKQDQSGCSIHIESLMVEHDIPTADLVDWTTHCVGRFTAGDVRDAQGGVVAREDLSDPLLGRAHGLIRVASPGMRSKPVWSAFRSKLLEKVQYFDTDPGYAATTTDKPAPGIVAAPLPTAERKCRELLKGWYSRLRRLPARFWSQYRI